MKKCAVFDIDDTLLKAQGIFIKQITSTGHSMLLTTSQFATHKLPANSTYSFEDFECPELNTTSITSGTPIYANLLLLQKCIEMNHDIAILTARGLEDNTHKAINDFLKNHLTSNYTITRNLVFAVNDPKFDPRIPTATRKLNILKNLAKKYSSVLYIDDDCLNIRTAKQGNVENLECIHYDVSKTT
jgi:hypothetical protein